MAIQNVINTALYNTLNGGTALTNLLSSGSAIYFLQAPDELTDSEYVVFSVQFGGDENLIPARMVETLMNVRAISTTGPALAGSIDAQIDTLLHGKQIAVTGWNNFWIAREQEFQTVQNDDAGVQYWTSGGMYRFRLDQA